MKNLIYPDEVRTKVRNDMAELYRKIRKDNPAIARLFFKREKACVKFLTDSILYGNSDGGLSGLLQ